MTKQNDQAPTVFIVDDDAAIRFAMQALMDSVNLDHEIYGSGDEFPTSGPAAWFLIFACRDSAVSNCKRS